MWNLENRLESKKNMGGYSCNCKSGSAVLRLLQRHSSRSRDQTFFDVQSKLLKELMESIAEAEIMLSVVESECILVHRGCKPEKYGWEGSKAFVENGSLREIY